MRPGRGLDPPTLRRKSPLPIWLQITWRVALVLGLLAIAVVVHWLERDGLKDTHDGVVSFTDVIYFTMISITTTGYGDIVPISDEARMFDAFVVTPIRIFFVLIFIGTAYTFVFRRTWENWRMERIQRNLCDHVIVAGFGTSGSETVDELLARGTPAERVVVIDTSAESLERAEQLGCAVLNGDATRDKTLQAVRVAQASALIISAGRDDTSILITLTARHLAPNIPISVAVRNEDNELLARQAGASTVINPVSFAGLLLAGSTYGPHISDYLADLASSHGRVVRIYRGDTPHGFWEPEAQALLAGDVIVEILPTLPREADLP
jgi:voltage-gated potassium channel